MTKFNAENFRMSISEMFKYREILEKKRIATFHLLTKELFRAFRVFRGS